MFSGPGYKLSALIAMLTLGVGTAWAAAANLDYYAARKLCIAAQNKDPIALWSLRNAAAGGDAQGEYWLGRYYLQRRNAKAFKWLGKPAVRSMKAAQRSLGICYLLGLGTKANPPIALQYFRVAAKDGNAMSQYTVGMMYSQGYGAAKNIPKAISWLKEASLDGSAPIQNAAKRRILLIKGSIAVSKAEKLFHQGHYTRAFNSIWGVASKGYAPAQYLMGNFYAAQHAPYTGPVVTLPPAQVKKLLHTAAKGNQAIEQLKAAAQAGDLHAMCWLGIWYEHNFKLRRARIWLHKASWGEKDPTHGDPFAQYCLYSLYANGFRGAGLPLNSVYAARRAKFWLHVSANNGYVKAEYWLGEIYFLGDVTMQITPNVKAGQFWLKKAAAQGSKRAKMKLRENPNGYGNATTTKSR